MMRALVEPRTMRAGRTDEQRNREGSGVRGRVLRFSRAMDRVVSIICQAMIISTTVMLLVLLGINVAARYVMHEGGIVWISEVPAQLFPWLIAGGIVMATIRGGHIAVDFAFTILGPRGGKVLAIFVQTLLVVSYIVLFNVVGDVAVIVASEHSPLLRIPGSWGYYALMFAAAGTALCSFNILIRVLLLGKAGLPEAAAEERPI